MLVAALWLPLATNAQSTGMQVNVNVNDTSMGTTLPAPGTLYFNVGDTPSVVAVAYDGYVLTGWDIEMSVSGVVGLDTTVNMATADVFDIIALVTGGGSWVVGPTDLFTVISVTANFMDTNQYVPDSLTVNVAVNDPTMGTTVPAPGTHRYGVGDTVSVVAAANDGYHLDGWHIQLAATSFNMDTTINLSIPDVFEVLSMILGVDAFVVDPLYATATISVTANFSVGAADSLHVVVAVNDSTMGTTLPAPGDHYFHAGDTVSVEAVAFDGYHLTGWHINVALAGQELDTTIDMAMTNVFELLALVQSGGSAWIVEDLYLGATISVTANFVEASQYIPDSMIVNVAVNNPTMGTTLPGVGTHYYAEGDTCHVIAEANPGYHLTGWTIQIAVGGAVAVDTTIGIAIRDVFDLVILIDEIRSRGDMSAYELIQMLARPMGDWVVEPLYAQATFNLTANFAPGNPASTHITYAVVNHDATRGSITPAEGIYNINAGEPVIASATANYGYELTAWIMEYTYPIWGIDLPVVSDTIRVNDPDFSNPVRFLGVMQQMLDTIPQIAMYLTAVFTPRNYTLTVQSADATMGSVDPHGSISVNYGGTFSVTAHPNAGYHFEHWEDETGAVVSTDNPYSFSVPGDVHLFGVFGAGGLYTVNVNWDASMGTVDFPTEPIMEGTTITLTATANDGYHFVNWTAENGSVLSTDNVYNMTVTGDVTLNANFEHETGIGGIEAGGFEVYSVGNTIVVKGAENANVNVYDVIGRRIGESRIQNSEFRMEVPAAGIYLVKVGNAAAQRVVVR